VLSDIDYNEYDGRIINDEGIGAIVGDGDKLYSIDGVNLKIYDLTTSNILQTLLDIPNRRKKYYYRRRLCVCRCFWRVLVILIFQTRQRCRMLGRDWRYVSHMAYDGSDWLYSVYEYGDHSSSDAYSHLERYDKANPTLYASPNVATDEGTPDIHSDRAILPQ